MTYPFVQATEDYGPRKGPVLGFVIHMAEGGGTVAFLSKPDVVRGVSVHYVIERTGRIVQMLKESHASGSINPKLIRTSDDPDGFYGATAAKAVLGDWWKDPNAAVISVEIEGFAASGPNAAQTGSLRTLVNDVRSRYPSIGLLGHRDFADYKACPGKLIDWDSLGGHAQEDEVRFGTIVRGKALPIKAGQTWKYLDGTAGGAFGSAATVVVIGKADAHNGQYLVELDTGIPYSDKAIRPTVALVESSAALVDAPKADCADAVAAEHERTRAAAIAAVEAIA